MNKHAHTHGEHTGAETEASRPPAAAASGGGYAKVRRSLPVGTRVADRPRRSAAVAGDARVRARLVSTGLEHVLGHGTSHRGHGGLESFCYIRTVLTQS